MAPIDLPALATLVRHSAASKRNLAVLAGVLALALLSAALGLAVVAASLYVLLIVWDVGSPRFGKSVSAARAEELTRLPNCADLDDFGLRVMVSSIRAGYGEIARVLRRMPAPIRAHVRAALAALEELRPRAARLIRELDELGGYLRAVPRNGVESELKRLEAASERANDEARAEYERAVSIRRDQLAAIDQIRREHDRISASLERIIATIEAFPSWIYRLRLLERSAREDLVSEVNRDLRRMSEDLSSSQQLLESLAASDGVAWLSLPAVIAGNDGFECTRSD
jgi:predicted transcriptional regulator